MFGLGKHGPDGRYGAIVDVGSGSVGVAIVASDPLMPHPEIIWSHRERVLLRDEDTAIDSAKHITTAVINTMLILGSEGIKALTEHERTAKIETVQVAIAAPWSYTITKTVNFNQEKSFSVTQKLVNELVERAQELTLQAIDENDIIKKLGLEVMTRATISISANNYPTKEPFGQCATDLAISHVSAISQKRLQDAIREGKDKVVPRAKLERFSFMLIFYCVMQELAPDTSEICLIDVTFEATEIGVVRDGVLKYVTHAPYGMYTIAREIAETCKIPKEEALAYVRGSDAITKTLSSDKAAALDAVVTKYESRIAELFKRTGDALSVPRALFLHTDSRPEEFYKNRLKNAAIEATKCDHSVHLVTSKLLGEQAIDDTALMLSATFFHKMRCNDGFEQV